MYRTIIEIINTFNSNNSWYKNTLEPLKSHKQFFIPLSLDIDLYMDSEEVVLFVLNFD